MRGATSDSYYQSCSESGQSEQAGSSGGKHSNSSKAGNSESSNAVYLSADSSNQYSGLPSATAAAAGSGSGSGAAGELDSRPGAFYSDALSRFAANITNAGKARIQFLDNAVTSDPTGCHFSPEATDIATPAAAAAGSSAAAAAGSSAAAAAGSSAAAAAGSSASATVGSSIAGPSPGSSSSRAAIPRPTSWRRSLIDSQEARISAAQVSIDTVGGCSTVSSASVSAAAAAAGSGPKSESASLDCEQKLLRSDEAIMTGPAVDMSRSVGTAAVTVCDTLSLTCYKRGQSAGAQGSAGSSAAASSSSTADSQPVNAHSRMSSSTVGDSAATAADAAAAASLTAAGNTLGGPSHLLTTGSSHITDGSSSISVDQSTCGGSTSGGIDLVQGYAAQGLLGSLGGSNWSQHSAQDGGTVLGNDNNSTTGGNDSQLGGNNITIGGSNSATGGNNTTYRRRSSIAGGGWRPFSDYGGCTIREESSTDEGSPSLIGGSSIGGSSSVSGVMGSMMGGFQTALDGSTIGSSSSMIQRYKTTGGSSSVDGSSRNKGSSSSKPKTWISSLINSGKGSSSSTSGGGSSNAGVSVSTAVMNVPVIHTGVLRSSSSSTAGSSSTTAAEKILGKPNVTNITKFNGKQPSAHGSSKGGSSSSSSSRPLGGSAKAANADLIDLSSSHSTRPNLGQKSPRKHTTCGGSSTAGSSGARKSSRGYSSIAGKNSMGSSSSSTRSGSSTTAVGSKAVQKFAEYQASIQKPDYSSLVGGPKGSAGSRRSPRIRSPEFSVSLRDATPHTVLRPKAMAESESPRAVGAGSKPRKAVTAAVAAAASSSNPHVLQIKPSGAAEVSALRSGAAAAAGISGSGSAGGASDWSSCSSTSSWELLASDTAAAAAVIADSIMAQPLFTEAVCSMAAENLGGGSEKQPGAASESQITRSVPCSPDHKTLDRSDSDLREANSVPDLDKEIRTPAKASTAGGSFKTSDSADGSVETLLTTSRSGEAAARGTAPSSDAAAAAAVNRDASGVADGSSSLSASGDDTATAAATAAAAAAAAAEDDLPPVSSTPWIDAAQAPFQGSSRSARLSISDGGNLKSDHMISRSGGNNSQVYRRSGSGSGSSSGNGNGSGSSSSSSSCRKSFVAVNLDKAMAAGSALTHRKPVTGRLLLAMLLLLLAVAGIAVGTGVAVVKHRSDQAEMAAVSAAAGAEGQVLAAAPDVHHLPFRVDMAVPALDADQGCRGWFSNNERVSAYRRIFAAAYSSVLKTPLPESVVTSIVCGGSTVFNVTADTPPQKALPALRSLLADDFEDLERPESAHRILLQLPPQNSGMKMVTVTTHFLVPAPTSISERLSVVETIKSKAAAVLSGPLRTFFMTPNTWPAGVGQLSGVFTVSHTLPAAADPRNLASGAPPVALAAPVLTFQVVIAVPATDETQSCAAWFGSSERVERYKSLFAKPFASALQISQQETVIKTVSCGNRTVYISSNAGGSSSSSDQGQPEPVKPARLLLESVPAAATARDFLTLVEVVTRFSVPAPTDSTTREEVAQTVTTQSSKLLSGPLSAFFLVSETLVNSNPMVLKLKPDQSGTSYDTAPTCQFQPTKTNSVADSHGRFWSMQDGKECVFRAQISTKLQPRDVTWEQAPSCGGKPTQYNSVMDGNNRLWGWQSGQSCVFKDDKQQPLGHTAAASRKVSKPSGRVGLVWEAVPTCTAAPNTANSEADTFGRLWGWENNSSCAYRWESLPS